ncbi:hypothetical protein ACQPUH_15455 [Clostridium perfringens]|nr:hypothetical protein SEA_LIFES_47 [Microbacterium phage Lifes]
MTDIQWGLETHEGEIFIMSEEICRDMAGDNEDYTLVVNRGDGWVEA